MQKIYLFLTTCLLAVFAFLPTQLSAQCSTPTNPATTSVQTTSADLSWSAVAAARAYRVRYKMAGTSEWTSKRTRSASLSLTNLQSGAAYIWQVKSLCKGSSSAYTTDQTFTTLSNCPTPTPFTPLGVGSHQATLVWENLNSQVDDYHLRWRELGAGNWNDVTDIATNLYIVHGLQPLITYEYQVRSDCDNELSPFSPSVEWTTPENVCTAPQNFVTTDIGTDFVSLAWGAVGGTEHYRVRYRQTGSSTWLFKDFIGGTSTTITGLFPDTEYEAQVQSECTLGATDWSDLINFTTDQIASCLSPNGLFASMISATAATHNWSAVTGALEYTLRRRIAGTTPWTDHFTTTETSLTTFALTPATTYEFQVKTHCTIGESPYSASAFYTTQADPPCPEATNLSVDDITPSSAFFDWDDVPEAQHYRFEWRPQGSSSWSWVTTTNSHISRTGLSPETVYEWRVGTLCTSGGTYTFTPIETFQTAPADQCTVPGGLFVLGVGQTQATLLWNAIPEADDYDVRIRPTGASKWTKFQGVTTNLKVVTGLTAGTEYEFQVRANCPSGTSAYSASYIFTTQAARIGTNSGVSNRNTLGVRPDQIRIFPNPAGQQVTVEISKSLTPLILRIYDVSGSLKLQQAIPGQQLRSQILLPQEKILPGLHLVEVIDQQGGILFRERLLVL